MSTSNHINLSTNQHESREMPSQLRLTKMEQEQIRKKSIEVNKVLIDQGMQPLQESDLLHKILEKTVRHAKVGENGEILINC